MEAVRWLTIENNGRTYVVKMVGTRMIAESPPRGGVEEGKGYNLQRKQKLNTFLKNLFHLEFLFEKLMVIALVNNFFFL
jgi:hypothetical protein